MIPSPAFIKSLALVNGHMGLSLGFSNDKVWPPDISGVNALKVQDFMDLRHPGTVWGLGWET